MKKRYESLAWEWHRCYLHAETKYANIVLRIRETVNYTILESFNKIQGQWSCVDSMLSSATSVKDMQEYAAYFYGNEIAYEELELL